MELRMLAESEVGIWNDPPRRLKISMHDADINEKYDLRERRIVTESNREKLPNFVDALKRPNYIDLKPFYQRRDRWDDHRQSRLIESFIINIPVPPLFLYERSYNSYEVMDGQQRITAIRDFYENRFTLTGLELWPELNGRSYATLPAKIRAGIDRRSISYIVLLKESAESEEEELLLKQLVFERLNTGGVKLGHQEIRNSLYPSKLNALLLELARLPSFTAAWDIPPYTEGEQQNPPPNLAKNKLYQTMGDAEVVLRFFALRHYKHFRRGMQGFLNLYMIRSRNFTDSDISTLQGVFERTMELATQIYGSLLFRPYDPIRGRWANSAHRAFYDAVMVGLSAHLDADDVLIERKEQVIENTKKLFVDHPPGTFTGRGNTKADIVKRIELYAAMLQEVVAA
jgi:hypothetical protein